MSPCNSLVKDCSQRRRRRNTSKQLSKEWQTAYALVAVKNKNITHESKVIPLPAVSADRFSRLHADGGPVSSTSVSGTFFFFFLSFQNSRWSSMVPHGRCRRSTFTDAQSPRSRVTLARPPEAAGRKGKQTSSRAHMLCRSNAKAKTPEHNVAGSETALRGTGGAVSGKSLARRPSPETARRHDEGARVRQADLFCRYVLFMFAPIRIHFNGAIFLDLSEKTLSSKTLKKSHLCWRIYILLLLLLITFEKLNSCLLLDRWKQWVPPPQPLFVDTSCLVAGDINSNMIIFPACASALASHMNMMQHFHLVDITCWCATGILLSFYGQDCLNDHIFCLIDFVSVF